MSALAVMAPLEPLSSSEMNAAASSSAPDEQDAGKDAAAVKAVSLERAEKRKEREQKKAEKEAKRQKIEENQKRSATFMSHFVLAKQNSSPQKPEQIEVVSLSDYQRTFPPCTYKDMAPINRFAGNLSHSPDAFGTAQMCDRADLLQDMLSRGGQRQRAAHSSRRPRKGIQVPVSVRDTMRLITEAGILGDDRLEENGRRGFANLSNRKRVPMKLLHFASDRRPAWYGTWTRSSTLVGARRPFGQDPVAIDYSYDSDAEWEEFDPMEGDDVQDNDNDEDDRCSRSDSDSEMDDWLIDDLEEDEEEGAEDVAIADRAPDADVFDSPSGLVSKSKATATVDAEGQKKKRKVKPIGRRFEAKLVKFETGPHWEQQLGITTYDGFRPYKMEMLNDAYVGLDPFSFKTHVEAVNAQGDYALSTGNAAVNGGAEVVEKSVRDASKPSKKGKIVKQPLAKGLNPLKKGPTSRPVKLKDKLAAKGLLEQAINLLSAQASSATAIESSSIPAHEAALASIKQSYELLYGSKNAKVGQQDAS